MLSFTCEGLHADRSPLGTDWWVAGLRGFSQFGVIGRKVAPRLMLQCNPHPIRKIKGNAAADRRRGRAMERRRSAPRETGLVSAALWRAVREGRAAR